jgi:membrane protease YdiL (CAAX protease family)
MELTETITATDLIWLAGLILLACWLLDTSLGRKALADSPPRRNSMPPYLPLVPLLLWFGAVSMTIVVVQKLTPDLQGWQKIFRDNLVMSIGAIVTIAAMMFLAHVHFARRLKGFGLNIRTIAKDFFMAFFNLLAVWPLILAAVTVTIYVAKLFTNQDYQMQQHQQLEMITEYPQLPVQITIIFVAVVIAPLLEEMMFRGFVQTTIRSYINTKNSAWPAIAASSVFFAMMHADPSHWPSLFILGVCLGYSYEKSGSLLRPIFIHFFFNATSIIGTLFQ